MVGRGDYGQVDRPFGTVTHDVFVHSRTGGLRVPGMFVVTEDGRVLPLQERAYESEAELQDLIADNPELIPGELVDEIDPRRWLLVRREAGIAFEGVGGDRWAVDHLLLDQDGISTLVEVKRATDTRARREVVAQMLDYASSLSLNPPGGVRATFEESCRSRNEVPDELLAKRLLTSSADPDIEAFWSQVDTNLQAGRLRLIFLADRLSPEVRRIIEFLNLQFQSAEVIGIELRQWQTAEGLRALVPTVLGGSARSEAKSGAVRGKRLTADEYLVALRNRNSVEVAAGVEEVMRWCTDQGGFVTYGRSPQYPGCFLNWTNPSGLSAWPVEIFAYGTIELLLPTLQNRPPFDNSLLRTKLRELVSNIEGVTLPSTPRPPFPIEILGSAVSRGQFLDVLTWFVQVFRDGTDVGGSGTSV
jgi:hypothetical protein